MSRHRQRATFIVLAAALLFVAAPRADAQTVSIAFQQDASGAPLVAGPVDLLTGSSSATMSLGVMSAFGIAPSGVQITAGSSSWTARTYFRIRVSTQLLLSPGYTLRAQLASADPNYTWSVSDVAIVSGADRTITSSGSYGVWRRHDLTLTIPKSAPEGALSNTIQFTVIAN